MQIIDEGHFLEKMAQFFMDTELYQEAQNALLALLEIRSANAWILHALAITYQKQDALPRALQYEQQAELLDPDNMDILMSIQQLCLLLDKHNMRVNYLKRIEEKQKLDLILELGMIYSQMESKQYDEALQRCHKLKYLKIEDSFANRSIAWCSLMTQKPDAALKYYKLLLKGKDIIWGDYLNIGNTAWINGNIMDAVSYYKTFVYEFNKSEDAKLGSWIDAFEESEEILENYGIDHRDICLIKEIIKAKTNQ